MINQKQKIVSTYIERGNLLTPEALEKIVKTGVTDKQFDTLIVDKDMLEDSINFSIIKNFTEKPSEIRKEDFISFYASKFEKMKKIITSRMNKDFVSLNKTDILRNEVYVIGIVREAAQKNEKYIIELEDTTDTKKVQFDAEQEVEIEDVVAVNAVSGGAILFGKALLYPDIPIRQPTKGTGKGCFISDLHLDETPKRDAEKLFAWLGALDVKNIFIAGDIGDLNLFEKLTEEYCKSKTFFCIPGHRNDELDYPTLPDMFSLKNIVSLSNPSVIEVSGLLILMVHSGSSNFLKKRHIGKSKLILKEDYLIMDVVPDIMHCGHTHKPEVSNYKSVSIVNAGSMLAEFKPVIIDFETREVTQAGNF